MAYFLDFEIETEGVTFYPRPETELLVERAVELFPGNKVRPGRPLDILDIGTGCGNIAIGLTKCLPSSRITALDISGEAIRTAGENAKKYGVEGKIRFIKSNLFEGIKGAGEERFDLIISNPPYISLEDLALLPSKVKDDPYLALYGGTDGMDFYRKIIRECPSYLKPEGFLLMEIGYNQSEGVQAMLEGAGTFCGVRIYKDYSGIDRIVEAKPARAHING